MAGSGLADGAVLTRGERIIFVGPEEAAAAHTEPGELDRVDLKGRALLPGLCDCHQHLVLAAGEHALLDLKGAADLEQVLRRVEAGVAATPAGEWIQGHGWERRRIFSGVAPSPALLDRAAPDHPVYLASKDWHSAWLNSVALAAVSEIPGGCELDRSTGLAQEEVVRLRSTLVPPPSRAELERCLDAYLRHLWSLGITTVHAFESPEEIPLIRRALGNAHGPRVRAMVSLVVEASELEEQHGQALGEEVEGWLRVGGVKTFTDGTFGSFNAAVSQPFLTTGGRGFLEKDVLDRFLDAARDARVPVAAHAVGDRAVEAVVQGLRARAWPDGTVHRLEHAQLLPSEVADLTGLALSVQPSHMRADRWIVEHELAWAERPYALRTMVDRGALLLFGSDAPVESADPWRGIQAAVTRLERDETPPWNGQERLTMAQALAAHTLGPARIHGPALGGGVIAPGRPADLVVLNQDPFALGPGELQRLVEVMEVEQTYLAGELVYRSNNFNLGTPRGTSTPAEASR